MRAMSTKLLRAVSLVAGLMLPIGIVVGTSSTALAQGTDADKAKAKAAYKTGTIKYNLGEWELAIKHFKVAFESFPDASFLFNIAQSYRQFQDCKQGAFFYKRYLALKPDASNKREVEGFIKDLNAECKRREEAGIVTPPPPVVTPDPVEPVKPDTTTTGGTTTGGTQVADTTNNPGGEIDTTVTPGGGEVGDTLADENQGPKLLIAHASAGSSVLSMGDLDTGAKFNMTVGAGYPLKFGNLTVDGGGLISYTNLPWSVENGPSGTVALTSLLLNVGVGMEVANKISVRGELCAGIMLYSGLDQVGNIFVQDGMAATGALSTASFRIAVGGDYAITDNLSVNVQPIVYNVSPAPENMRVGIDSVTAFHFLAGVGYRM